MLALDKNNWDTEVTQAPGLVLVDFWSPKCEPCMALKPEIEALEETYPAIKFCALDITQARRLAMAQKVMGLPVVALYQAGVKERELTGEITKEQVEAMILELLG